MNKPDTRKEKIIRIAVSFFLAFFLWLFAFSNTEQTDSVTFKGVPITFINEANLTALDLVLDNDEFSVDITLYGSTLQVSKIKKADLFAIADVASIKSVGLHSIEISISGVTQNVSVSDMSSRYINVSVSDMKHVEKPVEIIKTGSLAEGYAVIGESVSHNIIEVYGNEANVSKVASVKGEINVNSLSADAAMRAQLVAYDEEGNKIKGVTVAPATVDVNVTVGKIKEVPLVVSTTGSVDSQYILKSIGKEFETVKIAAKENILRDITEMRTASLDLTGRTSSFETSLSVQEIEGVVNLTDNLVTVNVAIEAKKTKEIAVNTINMSNSPEGYSCSIKDFSSLTAVFMGEDAALEGLSETSVSAYVDLSGLEEGEYTLKVQFKLPDGVTLKSSSVGEVKVIISR